MDVNDHEEHLNNLPQTGLWMMPVSPVMLKISTISVLIEKLRLTILQNGYDGISLV